jgi:lipopolysaccharide export system protein LptA
MRIPGKCRLPALVALLVAGWSCPLVAESFSFSADSVQSVMAEGKERTVLSGRAHVRSGSLDIRADRIEITGKDSNFLECTGGVLAVDDKRGIKIDTPLLRYDRKKKFSHMEGPSVLEDRKNKVVLKALWIENDGETDLTVAQVNVRILKEDLACRAEYAIYRRADKSLELTGAPSAYKKGDEYRATRILVNTDTEEIELEGEVQGSIKSASQAEEGKGGEAENPALSDSPAAAPKPESEGAKQ